MTIQYTIVFIDLFLILQGAIFFSCVLQNLSDPSLQRLAANLPARLIKSKAPNTVDRYSKAFMKFKTWASGFGELQTFPASPCSVILYF